MSRDTARMSDGAEKVKCEQAERSPESVSLGFFFSCGWSFGGDGGPLKQSS